ncbi:MAG: lamin tail domain-containing protein [bacterium]
MKKIITLIITILVSFSLTACYKAEEDNHIIDIVNEIIMPTQVSNSFDLLLAKENVELSWKSNSESITISKDKAIVEQSDVDVNVKLTLTAKRNEQTLSKDFSMTVLKKVVLNPDYTIYTIEELFDLEDDTKIKLESVTVADSYSSGTHFTDGEHVIYAYRTSNLTVGDTYEILATKSSYGEGVNKANQISVVTATKIEDDSKVLEPIKTTIEELVTTTNFSYYNITGTVSIEDDSLFIKDNEFKVEVSSYNKKESLELLSLFENQEVNLNVYITGGQENRTVLTYVDETSIDASDIALANAASNFISIPISVKEDITLPNTSTFNTTITWSSDNEAVLSGEGVVNRLEDDTTVILTATITLNEVSITKDFEVIVISSLQIDLEDLFISEYYEGKSYDKYIEIYNPNDTEVNLFGYSIKIAIDGADFTLEVKLSGTLQANEVIVVASSDSRLSDNITDAVTNLGDNGIFDTLAYRINGNDTIGLFYEEELVDIFGVLGENPGSKWNLSDGGSTVDHRIIRNPEFGANPSWNTSEWTTTAVSAAGEYIDNLGKHTYTGGVL